MVNFPPIYNAGGNSSTSNSTAKKIARKNVQASSGANGKALSTKERRSNIDRRKAGDQDRLMDRRNGAKRRRSSINLSV